jgi:hypothetical protein
MSFYATVTSAILVRLIPRFFEELKQIDYHRTLHDVLSQSQLLWSMKPYKNMEMKTTQIICIHTILQSLPPKDVRSKPVFPLTRIFPCSKEILVLVRNLQGNKIYKEKYTN